MYAVTGDQDLPIAVIGAVAVVLAAGIPALLAFFASRRNRHTLGTPNGRGNVVEMNEEQLTLLEAIREGQTVSREHLRLIDSKLDAHSELDVRRFRLLHQHLQIPFEENP